MLNEYNMLEIPENPPRLPWFRCNGLGHTGTEIWFFVCLLNYTNSCSHHRGQNVSIHLGSGDFDPLWIRNYSRLSA